MSHAISLRRVSVRSLRNLTSVDFEPAPRLNVIAGANGHGKTSLLEAIYVVATTRSFRAERAADVVQTGAPLATVIASVEEAGVAREQRAVIGPNAKSYLVDGKRPERLAVFATLTPVVVFHPGDIALVSGPSALRRTLLDRVALFLEPTSSDHRRRYTHALRGRQRVLDTKGVHAAELDAYEDLLAVEGAAFAGAHARAAERLTTALLPAFTSMAAGDLRLEVTYLPGGAADPTDFRAEIGRRRAADLRRRGATYGPHRDELALAVNGRAARTQASQGQQRILTLALKIAELRTVSAARGADPILLLDDVSSELDPARTGAVYDFLRAAAGQVFVTTTRPDLFVTGELASGTRADFSLCDGALLR